MSIRRLQIGEKIEVGDMVALPAKDNNDPPWIDTFEAGEGNIGQLINENSRPIYRLLQVNTSARAFEILREKIQTLRGDLHVKSILIEELRRVIAGLNDALMAKGILPQIQKNPVSQVTTHDNYIDVNNCLNEYFQNAK